ncbi:MAG: C40 family peptidase [Flavisolibacter sp.]
MQYAICTVPAAPVRMEPSHRTEMSNQLLFGETMEVLEEKEEWFKIKSLYDGYEGWLTYHLITEVNEQVAMQPLEHVAISDLNVLLFQGNVMKIPRGSHLTGLNVQTNELWTNEWEYHGSIKNVKGVFNGNDIVRSAHEWLNAPYLWGGKTLMGVDCSGFVQTVFKLFGIQLLRDAYQQAEQGILIERLEKVKEGDVAFFQNENGKVTHVGILLNSSKIIHASGKVRIDTLDEQGIVNTDNGRRTHQLHSVRRVF